MENGFVKNLVRFQRTLRTRANEEGERGASARAALAQEYFQDYDPGFMTMAECLVGLGTDERGEYAAYYDFWDLDVPALGTTIPAELVAGWPIEFYDRIHFDRSKVVTVHAS